MCDCIKITYRKEGETTVIVEALVNGTFNGFNTWEVVIDGVTWNIWHDASDNWYITETVGVLVPSFGGIKTNVNECPLAALPVWIGVDPVYEQFETSEGSCAGSCDCIRVRYQNTKMDASIEVELTPNGFYNSRPWFDFTNDGIDFVIWWDGTKWVLTSILGNLTPLRAFYNEDTFCPFGHWENGLTTVLFAVVPCDKCVKLEDRIFREYKAIKLPVIFQEEDRGYFRCCCPFKVLASNTGDSWKNDVTSAWIKLSDPSDTVTATLKKGCCNVATYIPTPVPFVNEENAFYWTIPWKEVLSSDGPGCYSLVIEYNISGIIQEFTWGVYELQPYSIENALTTARIRAIFDSYQEIEGINFTGSQVEDTIRFFGFIGNRQPNTEIDNLIYQNREMKKVIRENLNTYEILTDPTCEQHIKKLTDLYLLSENQLFISDYNAHNHSYRYQDTPVIVQNSPEITYFELSREASLKCIVGAKFKNQRSIYK